MIELFGKLSLGIPAVIVVMFLVFWLTGGLDEKVETPIIDDVPEVPTITLPTEEEIEVEVENNTQEPGTVIQEIQKGYMMKDRLLRPSLVGVAKNIEEKKEKK